MDISTIVRQYLDNYNIKASEFSRESGLSKAYLTHLLKQDEYLSGPTYKTLQKIAKGMHISYNDLSEMMTDSKSLENFRPESVKIPVLGCVRAGIPLDAIEEIIDYEEITPEFASRGEFFGLRVSGDSMSPRFCDGDVVIVKKQSDIDSGDIGIVLVNGNDATIKKVVKNSNSIVLMPLNPNYQPMMFTPKQTKSLPVRIIGKVVELRAKF